MQISKLSALIGLSTVLLLGPLTAAQAQKPGLYVGAAVGAYSIDESNLSDKTMYGRLTSAASSRTGSALKVRVPISTASTMVATRSRRTAQVWP
jgi:hypothetical protein